LYYQYEPIEEMINCRKVGKNWLLQNKNKIALITPWNQEILGNEIGMRISNACGNITTV
jgi:hypothetical protein